MKTSNTKHPTNPMLDKYMNRSAKIVPIGKSRFDAGRNVSAANQMRKKAALFHQ